MKRGKYKRHLTCSKCGAAIVLTSKLRHQLDACRLKPLCARCNAQAAERARAGVAALFAFDRLREEREARSFGRRDW